MKVFDCTTFFNENLMLDIRFNILDKFVDKFVITEALFSHSGLKKKLNFNINNYRDFKKKIIYIPVNNEPNDIIYDSEKIIRRLKIIQMLDKMLLGELLIKEIN